MQINRIDKILRNEIDEKTTAATTFEIESEDIQKIDEKQSMTKFLGRCVISKF